ncbi:uncharacterized protein LOC128982735 [Macrosteles quadrilineatus]|uniref:uncharacterized protein LOC128982735 n=1 Tax=Macrosteles quadrilineatus TaxID=74068 RepID=UPI0023E28A63|nr:uncharacterized protein LOC128982735 [Macrosteles quadrilineatus]
MKLNKNRRLCESHFQEKFILPSGRLAFNALPNCYTAPDEDTSSGSTGVLSANSREALPSTSTAPGITTPVKTPRHPPPANAATTTGNFIEIPSTSTAPVIMTPVKTPRRRPPPAATSTGNIIGSPSKRPRLISPSPSPVLLRQTNSPRRYHRQDFSTPLQSPLLQTSLHSPVVTTPSSTFWISNASTTNKTISGQADQPRSQKKTKQNVI